VLHYPKIPSTEGCPGGRCVAFEKIDGTNLHWVWHRELGWHAFGTRRDVFDLSEGGIARFSAAHPGLDDCVDLFRATLAGGVEAVFREWLGDCEEVRAFTEYAGPQSFAGRHRDGDPRSLVLFDVEAVGFGLLGPETFIERFDHLPTPRVVYRGKFTGRLTDDVRRGRYSVAEGVVIKGGAGGPDLWMAKVKTDAYRERLRASFAERWEDYWE
jgi:hypothetical protein